MAQSFAQISTTLEVEISGDDPLLQSVFTHPSCAGEISYERLEFLGDRVLGLAIAQMLYQLYPDSAEGGLAKRLAFLVSSETLAKIARETALDQRVHMKGGSVTEAIRADIVEAFLGYLYLRHGEHSTKKFIDHYWQPLAQQLYAPPLDARSQLQELSMKSRQKVPEYRLIKQEGTDHQPTFTFAVNALKLEGKGTGRSKQAAKTQAAKDVLDQYFSQKS